MKKIRSHFTFFFFLIICLFFFIMPGIIYFFARNGISVGKISLPITLIFLLIGILCFILGYMISLFLLRNIFTPLEQLSGASKQITKGNYQTQIAYRGKIEEIQTTLENFNFMARELNSLAIMRNDFIANVSHGDIRVSSAPGEGSAFTVRL